MSLGKDYLKDKFRFVLDIMEFGIRIVMMT